RDFEMIGAEFKYSGKFLPMCKVLDRKGILEANGIALFSKLKIEKITSIYYQNPSSEIKPYSNKTLEDKRSSIHQGVIWATIDNKFTVANTHFTWTPNGMPNKYQEDDLEVLLK